MNSTYAIILGSTKCGTTSLFKYLSTHPEVCPSRLKETNYFNNQKIKHKTLSNYNHFYSNCKNQNTLLEATPTYLDERKTAETIHSTMQDKNVKLIIILRDPVERFISWYKYALQDGRISMSFKEFFELNLLSTNEKNAPQYFQSLRTGLYSKNINVYLEFFKTSQIKIIYSEDLKNTQTKTLNELCKFLNISDWFDEKIDLTYNQTVSLKFPKLNLAYKKFKRFIRERITNQYLKIIMKSLAIYLDKLYDLFNKKYDAGKINLDENTINRVKRFYEKELMIFQSRSYLNE